MTEASMAIRSIKREREAGRVEERTALRGSRQPLL